MARRRALLIVNRHCRQGGRDLSDIVATLNAGGLEVVLERTRDVGRTAALIRDRAVDFDLLILGGGDGTLRSAIQPLLDSGKPLGVLPMGTANDLARSLGIPFDLQAAAAAIAGGLMHRIDIGRVNGHYFFNVSNIGLGVSVTRHLSYELKQRWGVFAYARALWLALRGIRAFGVEIVCDGERHVLRSIQIAVGNGRFYGGGMAVHADAALDDGLMHLYSVRPQRILRLLRLLPALRRGDYGRFGNVTSLQGRDIEIHTRRRRLVSADGDLVSHTPAHYQVLPAALAVLVPREARTQAEGLVDVAH